MSFTPDPVIDDDPHNAANAANPAIADTDEAVSGDDSPQVERLGLHFMVVDDDPADQTLCELLLKQSDDTRTVHCEPSGTDALAYLATSAVDCILLDYHLLDGQADMYIEQFAAASPWTPIIMLSGAGSESKAARALRLGAADYLTKDRVTAQALQRSILNAITKADLSRSLHAERNDLISANKELLKQRREIQSFYHTVSHELKTPITAVREFCSLVADEVLGSVSTAQKEALETSIGCCDRLTRLVNDLFDAARIETGKLELHKADVSLQELVAREVKIMEAQADERQISLVFAHDTGAPMVHVDPSRISQVMCNLISNAIKYTDFGGKIKVSVAYESPTDTIRVRVVDNGFGISSEHAEFIFDRLYQCSQIDETDVSSQNGMGIGLYLCHQIIHLHGGEISVESVMGEGSTFEFYLPVGSDPA